jgi:hypothetical protein
MFILVNDRILLANYQSVRRVAFVAEVIWWPLVIGMSWDATGRYERDSRQLRLSSPTVS